MLIYISTNCGEPPPSKRSERVVLALTRRAKRAYANWTVVTDCHHVFAVETWTRGFATIEWNTSWLHFLFRLNTRERHIEHTRKGIVVRRREISIAWQRQAHRLQHKGNKSGAISNHIRKSLQLRTIFTQIE